MPTFFTITEVIQMAIQTEKIGRDYYQGMAKKTKNPELQELFGSLAEEEIRHEAFFKNLYQKIKGRHYSLPYNWPELQKYLRGITESRFFTGEEKGIKQMAWAKTKEEIIKYAIGFEKETVLFYLEILNLVPPEDIGLVQEIINEEKSHIRRLAERLPKIKS